MVCFWAISGAGGVTGGAWIHDFAYGEGTIVADLAPFSVRKGQKRGDLGPNRPKTVPY